MISIETTQFVTPLENKCSIQNEFLVLMMSETHGISFHFMVLPELSLWNHIPNLDVQMQLMSPTRMISCLNACYIRRYPHSSTGDPPHCSDQEETAPRSSRSAKRKLCIGASVIVGWAISNEFFQKWVWKQDTPSFSNKSGGFHVSSTHDIYIQYLV